MEIKSNAVQTIIELRIDHYHSIGASVMAQFYSQFNFLLMFNNQHETN